MQHLPGEAPARSFQFHLATLGIELVKERRLPASELLHQAIRTEIRRRKLQSASRRYTVELAAQVGQPTPRQRARAVGKLAERSRSVVLVECSQRHGGRDANENQFLKTWRRWPRMLPAS